MGELKGIAVWTIERDNGDGRITYRKSFKPLESSVVRIKQGGRIVGDDLQGGRSGTIVVPEGTTLGETEAGDTVLVLPDGSSYGPDEAWALAKDRSFGLSAITGH